MSRPRIDWEARFYESLNRIANGYGSSRRVMAHAGQHGLEASEALEYAYDNIQDEARAALRGYRVSKKKADRSTTRSAPVQATSAPGDREDPPSDQG